MKDTDSRCKFIFNETLTMRCNGSYHCFNEVLSIFREAFRVCSYSPKPSNSSFWNDYESSVIGLASQKATYSSMMMSNEAQEFALQWIGADKMIWLQAQADIHWNAVKRGQLTEKEAALAVAKEVEAYATANQRQAEVKLLEEELRIAQARNDFDIIKMEIEAAGLPSLDNLMAFTPAQRRELASKLQMDLTKFNANGPSALDLYNQIGYTLIRSNAITDYYNNATDAIESRFRYKIAKSSTNVAGSVTKDLGGGILAPIDASNSLKGKGKSSYSTRFWLP